jgi:hypothetical protein
MFALAALQIIASALEGFVSVVLALSLFPVLSGLSALAQKPVLILYAYFTLLLNVALLR